MKNSRKDFGKGEMMKQAVVFFSGGMDSFINLVWAIEKYGKENIKVLYIDFGHKYRQKELHAARLLTQHFGLELDVKELPLGQFENPKDAHIPLRNIFILLYGTFFGNDIIFGMLHHESSEDKNEMFMMIMQMLLETQFGENIYHDKRKVRIICPFARMTKTEMVHWYLAGGHPAGLLMATVGCYWRDDAATLVQCGQCTSCFNRWVALTNNGLTETYHLSLPYRWLLKKFELMLLNGNEKTNKLLLSIRQIWFKRKWLKEVWSAIRKIQKTDNLPKGPFRMFYATYKKAKRERRKVHE